MSSYDAWKTTNPHDNELGRSNGQPELYRCLTCTWQGRGIFAATEHWRTTEHNVKPASDPRFTAHASEKAKSA